MDNKPFINRDLLAPILIGGLSLVGIIVVLLIGRSLNSPPEASVTPSETPFQYIYLGTEPAITTPILEESETAQPDDGIPFDVTLPFEGTSQFDITPPFGATPIDTSPSFVTPSGPSASTPVILRTNTSTGPSGSTPVILRTNTPVRLATSTPNGTDIASNTYDDTDSRLTYVGDHWVSQTNVNGAHQSTLHVSTQVGDSVTFTFAGPEIHLFYQAGPSLGSVIITIDALGGDPIDQSASETQIEEWVSDPLPDTPHVIVIAHQSGGSVNIDALTIPIAAPTPTRTPTRTPKP